MKVRKIKAGSGVVQAEVPARILARNGGFQQRDEGRIATIERNEIDIPTKGCEMRTCKFCRTDNADDADRCASCGKPSAPQPAPDGIPASEPPPTIPPSPSVPHADGTATSRDKHPRYSRKLIAAIAGIALLAIAGAGAGITYAMGMWGHARPTATQPAQTVQTTQDQTQDQAQKPAQKPRKSQETQQKDHSGGTTDSATSEQTETNDRKTPEQGLAMPEDATKYHVSAQSYEFDLPQYWHNRVLVQVDGDAVTVLSKEYPDASTPICTIHVARGAEPTIAGDAATTLIGSKPLDNDHHIEVWMHYYPEIAALGGIELKSDAEYTELTDLQTGGYVDFAKERALLKAHEAGIDVDVNAHLEIIDGQAWIRANLIDALTVK